MPKSNQFAIPLLPASSMKVTVDFYVALGFKITYQQKLPNTYTGFSIRDIDVHFFSLKIEPSANFSTAYFIVENIDDLYESFRTGLKTLYGKIPTKGFPKLNQIKDMPTYGVRQFILVDPSGNYMRFGQPIEQKDSVIYAENNENKTIDENATQLQRVYEVANRFANGKDDLEGAVRVIDTALKNEKNSLDLDLFKVLVLRIDIANQLEDNSKIDELSPIIKDLKLKLSEDLIKDEISVLNNIERYNSEI